jgi:type 1 glutamine amidotransferase
MRHLLLTFFLLASLGAAEKKQVLLVAGRPSHGPGEHEHNAGVLLLAKCLREGAADKVEVTVALNGQWPSDDVVAKADTILIYSDGGGGHPALGHLDQLSKKMAKGCGFVCLHYAVEPAYTCEHWDGKTRPPAPNRGSAGKGAKEFKQWLGGYFEQHWSVNPFWTADFKQLPDHPVSRGVKPFSSYDEWYFYMRFVDGMKGITPTLSAIAGADTMKRGDGPHSGNPEARASVAKGESQVVGWAFDRADGGRAFGFTGGHIHNAWGNDSQRKVVLNAILWTAKAEVPTGGVESQVSAEDLKANLDKK